MSIKGRKMSGKTEFIRITFIMALFLTISWIFPVPAFSLTPIEEIRAATDQVLLIFKNSKLNDEQKKKLVREALLPKFDFYFQARAPTKD